MAGKKADEKAIEDELPHKFRKREAERIIGMTTDEKGAETLFLVRWKDMDVADLVPARLANKYFPQVVIRFYEGRITWRCPENEATMENENLEHRSSK